EPLPPPFVSSVDSGNLVASLLTLQQGCLDRLRQPLLQPALAEGFLDYLDTLSEMRAIPRKGLSRIESELRGGNWLQSVLTLPNTTLAEVKPGLQFKHTAEASWFRREAQARVSNIENVVRSYAPWWLPEFAPLRKDSRLSGMLSEQVSLQL